MQIRSELVSIAKLDTLASLCGLTIYLQKTLYFLVSQRNIKFTASKHKFTDISDQNKQGFEGKKLEVSGSNAIFCDFFLFFVVDAAASTALGAGDN